MGADRELLNRLSERVIGCGFAVINTLGVGFFEKVYENALAHELRLAGLSVSQQLGYDVVYKDMLVGHYVADLIVEDRIVVELKVTKALNDFHLAQCANYLRASNLRLGLVLNFAHARLEFRRVVNNF
jgi:GxxExxY protein